MFGLESTRAREVWAELGKPRSITVYFEKIFGLKLSKKKSRIFNLGPKKRRSRQNLIPDFSAEKNCEKQVVFFQIGQESNFQSSVLCGQNWIGNVARRFLVMNSILKLSGFSSVFIHVHSQNLYVKQPVENNRNHFKILMLGEQKKLL